MKLLISSGIFYLILILFSHHCFAQAQFERTIGGGGNDYAYSVIETRDGGYAMAGYTNSMGAGVFDYYIVKLDKNGLMQWSKAIGGLYDDEAYSIIQTRDNNYVITGATYSFGAGNYDFYVVKLDSNGNLIWNRTYGSTASDYSYSIIETSDGGYAIAGYTSSFNTVYGGMLIMKIDTSGGLKWAKTIDGPYYDGATCIIQTTDGGYAVGGWYYYYSAEYYDFYIVKLDSNANLQWTRTVGGHGQDVCWSVKQTTDGGFIAGGFADSSSAGYYDSYFVRLDSAGNVLWTTTVGGSGDDYATSVVQTPDGGFLAAGQTNSFGPYLLFYLVKLYGNGTLSWTKTIKGPGNGTEGESIIKSPLGGYPGAGFNYLNGQADFFLVKFDSNFNSCGDTATVQSTTGTRSNIGSGGNIMSVTPTVMNPAAMQTTGGTVADICDAIGVKKTGNEIPQKFNLYQNYPNPFNPETNIKFDIPKTGFVSLKVYDISGQLVKSILSGILMHAGSRTYLFNGTGLASGVYFYTLMVDNNVIDSKKMMLLK